MAVRYRTHSQTALEEIAGRFFLIAYGDAVKSLPYLCEINKTAAYYWKLAEAGLTEEEMLREALKEYDASTEILERGLNLFLQNLTKKGYLHKESFQK